MTAPLTRLPAFRAAIAFLEKIWEPMAQVMTQPLPKNQPIPVRVTVEFGVHGARRRRPTPRITIRDWC